MSETNPAVITVFLALCLSTPEIAIAQSHKVEAVSADTYAPAMTFDVAAVRQSHIDFSRPVVVDAGWFEPADSGNIRLVNNDLASLIGKAYGVSNSQIEGIPPDFKSSAFFNVEAKCSSVINERLSKLPKEELELEHEHMIQVLLADRFHLKVHWDSRGGETYNLIVSRPGRLLSAGARVSGVQPGAYRDKATQPLYRKGDPARGFEYIGHGVSSDMIASMLSLQFGRPVSDKTGLTGKYDFDLKYFQIRSDDRRDDETNPWPPLEIAIQDQLGLKLVRSTGPTRVIVIDHVEKPSEN